MANLKILTQQLLQSKIPTVQRSGKIMDIGCGDGSFIISYMQPKELVGIDLNSSEKNNFLNNLKINNTKGYFTNSLNNLGDNERNSFDLITTIGVFELNNLRHFSRIKRILKREWYIFLYILPLVLLIANLSTTFI